MNYEEAKKKAKERYESALREIELCMKVFDKVQPNLPAGWECKINTIVFKLEIHKGYRWAGERNDAGEFKLVCKLIESIIGKKLERKAQVKNDGEIFMLDAEAYFSDSTTTTGISVTLYDPTNMPNCDIKWKRSWKKEAIISDECLGLNGR